MWTVEIHCHLRDLGISSICISLILNVHNKVYKIEQLRPMDHCDVLVRYYLCDSSQK